MSFRDLDPDRTLYTTTGQGSRTAHRFEDCPRYTHPRTKGTRETTLRKNPHVEPCAWCEAKAAHETIFEANE